MHDAEGPQSDAEGTFSGRRRKDRVAPLAVVEQQPCLTSLFRLSEKDDALQALDLLNGRAIDDDPL